MEYFNNLPITELFGPNAQMHAHSGGTVIFARAHCDSPYLPRIPPLGILKTKILFNPLNYFIHVMLNMFHKIDI